MDNENKKRHPGRPRAVTAVVDVKAEIIKNAVVADSSHCMIAEAIKVCIPFARAVSVDLQTIRFTDSRRPYRYVYLTPRTAQVPLIQFDQGVLPEPFRFSLRGGHVIAKSTRKHKSSDKSREASKKNAVKARAAARQLARAGLVARNGTTGGAGGVERIGGKAPPVTSFARLRAFGIRALGRPSLPKEQP